MGEVYLAQDLELDRRVALKVLPVEIAGSEASLQRFAQEAKLSSSLSHPHVAHVYEIGEQDGVHFIAMELVEGETMRRRIARGPLSIDESLTFAIQIASALSAAHAAGIIHRDIKPENVMIRPDGYVKVLDFGLAKLREFRGEEAATAVKTTPGMTMGTVAYMSPEHLEGAELDARSDLFSLGVVLYEMICGRRPFEGSSSTALITAILSLPPLPVSRADVPAEVEAMLMKALAKEPSERYTSAEQMIASLRRIQEDLKVQAIRSDETLIWNGSQMRSRIPLKRLGVGFIVVICVIALAIVAISQVREQRVRDAEQSLNVAEQLIEKADYAGAYALASAAVAYLPNDERAQKAILQSSEGLTVTSDPAGANVYLQQFRGSGERVLLGTTPLEDVRIARADYVMTIEKEGYAPANRPLSTTPIRRRGSQIDQPPSPIHVRLLKVSEVPPGMVFVRGGEYRLSGWNRPSDRTVGLADFFLDEHEVSNRGYQEFMRDGGYRRRELWKHPFEKDGKTLSFEEAMAEFQDTTGLPGPRKWSSGQPPPGQQDHPVTGVSWHEAAAFAEWKGRKLPTVFQWEKAARPPQTRPFGGTFPWGVVPDGTDVVDRANFSGKGALPVRSMPFGISADGAYHLAGNVAEWCRNPSEPGFTTRGGGWNDPVYSFGFTGSFPPFYSSDTLGFRCVRETRSGDQGDFALSTDGFSPRYQPVSDAAFAEIRKRYEYPKTPLAASVLERQETDDWTREKIRYNGAGGKPVVAYLYLPKGYEGPYQTIHFAPADDSRRRTVTASVEHTVPALILAGRAVFVVVLEGYLERPYPAGFEVPAYSSREHADLMVAEATDLRRGLDYLETRKDLDAGRIALYGRSGGSMVGLIVAAVEDRYRSMLLVGSGIRGMEVNGTPAGNRINFAPRISVPKLLLQGRYDETMSLRSDVEPLFALLTEPKRLELYDGGHAAPFEIETPVAKRWLDETLGPVAR